MSISSYYETIKRYNDLKASLLSVAVQLETAHAKLNVVPNTIFNVYSVNGVKTPIVGRTENLNSDIARTASDIRNVIIPAIDRAISHKRREIFQLEQNNMIA